MKKIKSLLVAFLLVMSTEVFKAQDEEPSLPSNLPSPKEVPSPSRITTTSPSSIVTTHRPGSTSNEENSVKDYYEYEDQDQDISTPGADNPLISPPQNGPEPPPPPSLPPLNSEPEHPPHRAIFGLDHVILILVPQFKTMLPHLPKWFGSNVKVSLPITVFFDKLTIPNPPLMPVTFVPFYGPFFPHGHYVKKRSILDKELVFTKKEKGPKPKRLLFDESIYGAERVMLIPRLEKLLLSFGLGGKPCLLRAICEVHEVPLHHHGNGLLGELLTLFFSISRSAFADTHHLSGYLKAEELGKKGDCSMYFDTCPGSMFYWKKTRHHLRNTMDNHDGINQGNDKEFDEILKHFL